jgi:steroid delta-isomerase
MDDSSSASLQNLLDFYHQLTPDRLEEIGQIYASDAYFKDPFNEVRGLENVKVIFVRMYQHLREPRFRIIDTVRQGEQACLTWEMTFMVRRNESFCIRGMTHVRFDQSGRVNYHRDYWDAAEELYEKLPLLKWLMRWLKKKVG